MASPGAPRPSILDLGAGVGQYGHALRSLDSGTRWMGFDGSGNVEEMSDGLVGFGDLTIPLALPRADYVMSLEVAEHVSHEHEAAVIRNLHVHNCVGIILCACAMADNTLHALLSIALTFLSSSLSFAGRGRRSAKRDRATSTTTATST